MFGALIIGAAACSLPCLPGPVDGGEQAATSALAVKAAVFEMTYDAFVATEETPAPSEIARPAIADAPLKKRAIGTRPLTSWIS